MEPIRIVSYCRGLPYNHKDKRPTVQMLFNDNVNAMICLQETWFTKQDLANSNALHPGAGFTTPLRLTKARLSEFS